MNYELLFYCLIAFILGRLSARPLKIYIGYDKEKYKNANFGLLLRD